MNQLPPIIKTLAFFKIYNHPLTLLELQEGLLVDRVMGWEEFKTNLDLLIIKGAVIEDRGFFFLAGGDAPVAKRVGRILWENTKMQIGARAAKILRLVPFIKLVAVCNTLSFGVSKPESDIDFFIVAKAGRLWLVRALAVFSLFIFGLYRRGTKTENKVCLSFFIDEKNLDLQKLALKDDEISPDIYLIYWITQIIPLINRERTMEKFWVANLWIKRYLANWDFVGQAEDYRRIKENWVFSLKRKVWEFLLGGVVGNFWEKFFKKIQLIKMQGHKKTRRFDGSSAVVVNDEILKFHEEDRRELFRKMWKENLNNINV
ncbi:MAG: hypothetical protein NTU97_03710 [Candidatus Magasanikbacteria bacterium]|nr:hypothetical protein [Candidatus Magasanikbacteria bacterium]